MNTETIVRGAFDAVDTNIRPEFVTELKRRLQNEEDGVVEPTGLPVRRHRRSHRVLLGAVAALIVAALGIGVLVRSQNAPDRVAVTTTPIAQLVQADSRARSLLNALPLPPGARSVDPTTSPPFPSLGTPKMDSVGVFRDYAVSGTVAATKQYMETHPMRGVIVNGYGLDGGRPTIDEELTAEPKPSGPYIEIGIAPIAADPSHSALRLQVTVSFDTGGLTIEQLMTPRLLPTDRFLYVTQGSRYRFTDDAATMNDVRAGLSRPTSPSECVPAPPNARSYSFGFGADRTGPIRLAPVDALSCDAAKAPSLGAAFDKLFGA